MALKLYKGLVLQSQDLTATRLNFHFSLVTNQKLFYLSAKTVWFVENGGFINALWMICHDFSINPEPSFSKNLGKKGWLDLIRT